MPSTLFILGLPVEMPEGHIRTMVSEYAPMSDLQLLWWREQVVARIDLWTRQDADRVQAILNSSTLDGRRIVVLNEESDVGRELMKMFDNPVSL